MYVVDSPLGEHRPWAQLTFQGVGINQLFKLGQSMMLIKPNTFTSQTPLLC